VTESAVLAVLYAWIVGACVYRETPWRAVPRLCLESGVVSAVSLWLIASASVFTWLLAREQVPQLVASALLMLSSQPWFFLLASLVLFTGFAALLEGLPAVIILGPLFYPLAAQMGVSALHFSILIVACVGIGLFLPPVGVGLLIACSMARATVPSVMGTVGLYPGGPPGRAPARRVRALDHPRAAHVAPGPVVRHAGRRRGGRSRAHPRHRRTRRAPSAVFSDLAILEKEDIFKGSDCLETSQKRQEATGVLCWEARGSSSSRCMPTIDPAGDTHPPDHPDVVPRRRPRRKDTMVTSPGVRPMQDAAAAVDPRGPQRHAPCGRSAL